MGPMAGMLIGRGSHTEAGIASHDRSRPGEKNVGGPERALRTLPDTESGRLLVVGAEKELARFTPIASLEGYYSLGFVV